MHYHYYHSRWACVCCQHNDCVINCIYVGNDTMTASQLSTQWLCHQLYGVCSDCVINYGVCSGCACHQLWCMCAVAVSSTMVCAVAVHVINYGACVQWLCHQLWCVQWLCHQLWCMCAVATIRQTCSQHLNCPELMIGLQLLESLGQITNCKKTKQTT